MAAYRDSRDYSVQTTDSRVAGPDRRHLGPRIRRNGRIGPKAGAGRISGTARPEEPGNTLIAGHRDNFFRARKDIAVGDSLALDTGADLTAQFVVGIKVVTPADVAVLARTSTPSLTLVTCYLFYFVGDAPQIHRPEWAEGTSGAGGALSATAQ